MMNDDSHNKTRNETKLEIQPIGSQSGGSVNASTLGVPQPTSSPDRMKGPLASSANPAYWAVSIAPSPIHGSDHIGHRTLQPLSLDQRHHLAQVAAYFLAERRGFVPGHEMQDWLEAVCQVASAYDGERLMA